jgi:tetratricopeptide (TPR) repeat protein
MAQNEEWKDGEDLTFFDSFTFKKIRKLKEKGGYGEIYLVKLKTTNEEFVVKKPIIESISDVTDLERLRAIRKEAQIMLTIPQHENIVDCLLVDRIKGVTHVFMVYYAGGDLEDYIKNNSVVSWNIFFLIAKQIIHGMIHLHNKGLIHGDLKPSNLLISDKISFKGNMMPVIKITDFGLSKIYSLEKAIQKLTKTEYKYEQFALAGFVSEFYTPAYAAPEQEIWKDLGTSYASDIFSFGIIAIELLTGILFFKNEIDYYQLVRRDSNVFLSKIRNYVKDKRKDVPAQLLNIILKCLEISPHKRYQSFEEILTEINGINQQMDFRLTMTRSVETKILSHGIRGYSLSQLGFKEDAKEQFKLAISIEPKGVTDFLNQGLSFHDLGKYENAIDCYDKILNSKEIETIDSRIIVAALLNKSIALDSLGEYDRSIECCDKALLLDQSNFVVLTNKGIALIHKKDYNEGIESLEIALSLNPGYVLALHNKGLALLYQDSYDKAIETFTVVLEINPTHTRAHEARGICFSRIGNYKGAIKDFDAVLSVESENMQVARQKLYALYNSKEYGDAVNFSDKILVKIINDIEIMHVKEMSLTILNRFEEAIGVCDNILKIDPKNVEALIRKSFIFIGMNRFEDAIKNCKMVLEIEPKNVEALNNMGLSLTHLNNRQEAMSYYDTALEIDPKFILALNNKAAILFILNQLREALNLVNRALEIDPLLEQSLLNKVIIQEALEDFGDSIVQIDRLLFNDPKNTYLLNRKGVLFAKWRKFENAIECFEQVLVIDPNHKAAKENKNLATELKNRPV